MELKELIEKYGSDKGISEYDQIYSVIFSPVKDEKLSVLEIGVGTMDKECESNFAGVMQFYEHYKPGGSLRVWRDYFKNSQIFGIDIGKDCVFEEDRIKSYLCDSTDVRRTNEIFGEKKFDVIIDDGSHIPSMQLKTLKNFFYRLTEKGLYVIEDMGVETLWSKPLIHQVKNIIGDSILFGDTRKNLMVIKKV